MSAVLAPVIILCPPRSFSSVVCACLGQHPELHGFPELNLFVTDSVGGLLELDNAEERRTGASHTHTAGLLRVVMHLEGLSTQPGALEWSRNWLRARSSWSTRALFDRLLHRIQPLRGVDKSPRTALSLKNMRRALEQFPDARFLHLTRHPMATIPSLMASRLSLQTGMGAHTDSEWDPGLANFCARLWQLVHQGITDFTSALPAGQTLRVKGEDVLRAPGDGLARIAEWLGLRVDASAVDAMLYPERSPYATPGVLPAGLDNDPGFLADPRLRPSSTPASLHPPDRWQLEPWLASEVRKLARHFGYD